MWAVVYIVSVLVLMASSAVIGYVWRIRDERVNEAINSRLQEAITLARQEMDMLPPPPPPAYTGQ